MSTSTPMYPTKNHTYAAPNNVASAIDTIERSAVTARYTRPNSMSHPTRSNSRKRSGTSLYVGS